jgi:hypothetical protein
MSFGVHLNLLIGPTVPVPAPPPLLDALDRVEVTHTDGERSGFQMVFRLGKSDKMVLDYALMELPLLEPGARVILTVVAGILPHVLMDGLITRQELAPGEKAGESTLTLTGEDVSFVMDQEEKNVEHPAQPETVIALKIIATYAQYGLIPIVIPPFSFDLPVPTERIPTQQTTDLKYLQEIAARHNYVAHVTPGPVPLTNTFYWGPDLRIGIPQPALTVDMGSDTNIDGINFQNEAADATNVTGKVKDRQTGIDLPVRNIFSLKPPLALSPALMNTKVARSKAYRALSGRTVTQALAEAQAESDATTDVVTGTGELDTGRYGHILKARGLVGVRGVGLRYDGLYYVKSVTHTLDSSGYKQQFTITREGTISSVPAVPVAGVI